MTIDIRGNICRVFRASIDTTGREKRPEAVTVRLQISNEGANVLRVYFNQQDFDADADYLELAASTGFFDGPVEIPDRYFLRAVGGATDVVALEYYRRA